MQMDHLGHPGAWPTFAVTKKPMAASFCNLAADVNNDTQVLTRSKYVFVTLNLYPYNNGHLMVVPYEHIQTQEMSTPTPSPT